jgi:ABC-2 type transport system ATP-binding protein
VCVLVIVVVAVGVTVLVRTASEPAAVRTQSLFLPVVDGPAHDQHIRLDATVYYPTSTPAPAVLLSPGFGETKTALDSQARQFAQRGFVVLTYTPRGFGRSGGQIELNSPDYEVADGKQLIDWLGRQPQVRQDGPDDPRVGVSGGSYGGALSLMLAGSDRRVDAIAPVITYNDLGQALIPNATSATAPADTPAAGAFGSDGVFKKSWASYFFAEGMGAPTAAGSAASAGAVCGRFGADVCRAYTELSSTGQASPQTLALLHRDSPVSVTANIHVPTLLVQGEQDTLFGLDQADANARQITRAGGKVQVIWYNGGHDAAAPDDALQQQIGDWLAFQLTGTGSNPLTGFQYAVAGSLHTNGTTSVRTVTATDYPGLTTAATRRQPVPLTGPAVQPVVNPPGGAPAAISGMPGVSGLLGSAASRLASDLPGEFATWSSAPLSDQLLVSGASTVGLDVTAAPGQPAGGSAELFVKLYDVAGDGTRTLPGSAVAPVRVIGLPAGGTAKRITVTLAGIVDPVQAGHRLQLVVSTTDSSYANATAPAALRISLAGGAAGALAVPVVAGRTSSDPLPVGQIIAIGVVLVLCVLAAAFLALRRRRRRSAGIDADLADVPLVLDGIGKSYPGGVVAVDSVSFRVEHGQVVGLLGPNGAGKTTTLRMLMGLVTPTAGEIRVFGQQVGPGSPVLSRIGSFVEGSGFLPHLSGTANLRLYWQATGRPPEQAHVEEALAIAGLGDAVKRKVGTYSQGMRQRLAIAQAMLGLPDLLVLDEPTNGLDPPQIRDMREVLKRYAASGRTVLVSSHLLSEVEQTCSHVIVMHHGRLVAAGEVGEIVTGDGETSFAVDDAEQAAGVLRSLAGVQDVSDPDGSGSVHAHLNGTPRAEAVRALVRAGVAVDTVAPRGRLEDVFLDLVGGDRR